MASDHIPPLPSTLSSTCRPRTGIRGMRFVTELLTLMDGSGATRKDETPLLLLLLLLLQRFARIWRRLSWRIRTYRQSRKRNGEVSGPLICPTSATAMAAAKGGVLSAVTPIYLAVELWGVLITHPLHSPPPPPPPTPPSSLSYSLPSSPPLPLFIILT